MSAYAELRAVWYAKLAASGFRDIENPDGTLTDRNQLAYARQLDPTVRQAASEYYSLATEYLHSNPWEHLTERRIWALHADGYSVREIASGLGCSKDYVQRRVMKHRECMRQKRPIVPQEESPG